LIFSDGVYGCHFWFYSGPHALHTALAAKVGKAAGKDRRIGIRRHDTHLFFSVVSASKERAWETHSAEGERKKQEKRIG
jgi:hypothetical protein